MRAPTPALLLFAFLLASGVVRAQPVFAGAASRSEALSGVADKVALSLGTAAAGFGATNLGAPSNAPAPRPERFEEIQRLLSDARGRYLEGDFQEAVAQAAEAMKRFEERFAFTTSEEAWSAYAEIQLVRALALRRLGKEREADDAFERLAALMPEYVPDPGLAPPKVASRYQTVLKALQDKPKVALDVASRPAGAEVILDGRKVGVTPLSLKDILPGVHFVAITLGSERLERRLVILKGQEKLSADLGDPRSVAARQLVAAMREPISEPALVRLASSVADETLVALVEPERDALLVLAGRVQGGKLVAVTGQRVDASLEGVDAAMAGLAAAALTATTDAFADGATEGAADLRARFLAPPAARRDPAPEDDGMGGVWVATGVGAGVVALVGIAAGAVGIYYLLNPPPEGGGVDVVIDGSRL